MDSPPPRYDTLPNAEDERCYRILLQHEFHPELTLPLWSPSVVEIGSVGYLRKPEGEFVTLFNASNPPQSSGGVLRDMANLSDYGKVKVTQRPQRQDKQDRRNSTGRRYSFGLRAKNKIAFLCAESATYTHIENLSAPELWFKDNADEILRSYAYSHPITKEDLFLVTGTLRAPDYALFVSHTHPNCQAQFEVFASPRNGQPWGEFSRSTEMTSSMLGDPNFREGSTIPFRPKTKVSETSASDLWCSLLLARLRFKPDVPDPTLL